MSSSPSTDLRARRAARWRGVVGALVAAAAIAAFAQGANDARRVTTTLTVRGAAEAPVTFSLADLAKLPVQRVEEARVLRAPAGNTETVQRLTGILLRDVLAAARLLDRDRFDLRRTMIVAVASDGGRANALRSQTGLKTISQKTTSSKPNAGTPSQNHTRR